jgi:hypothetical protein
MLIAPINLKTHTPTHTHRKKSLGINLVVPQYIINHYYGNNILL